MKGVVLLHGRGAEPRSMLPLLPAMGAEGLAKALPEAPGRSWWPTSFLVPVEYLHGPLMNALALVDGAILSLGLDRREIALVGVSQGACLALEYAARRGDGLGAVIALSGGLIGTGNQGERSEALYGYADKTFEYESDLTGTQVLITCHEQDPHIPLKRARDSVAVFEGRGAEARLMEHAGEGHMPMPEGLAAAKDLLAN